MQIFKKKKAPSAIDPTRREADAGYDALSSSDLFSASWYLTTYADVASSQLDPIRHYLDHGFKEGRDPGPWFSTLSYNRENPDVAQSGMNPLLHYIRHGRLEGRKGWTETSRRQFDDLTGFLDYSTVQPMFDAPFGECAMRAFSMMDLLAQRYERQAYVLAADDRPLVTVVMPVFNREAVVAEAVKSILAQSYSNFELIVVDDASEDGTIDVLGQFDDPRIVLITNSVRLGVSRSRNIAIRRAKGALIAYLDSDNTWLPAYLSVNVAAFVLHADVQTIYSAQYVYYEQNSKPTAVRFGSMNVSLLRNRNYIDLNCVVHRAGLDKTIGSYFREDMVRLVDWELILRLSAQTVMMSLPVIQSNYFHGRADNTITLTEEIGPALAAVRETADKCNDLPTTPPLRAPVAIVIVSFQARRALQHCIESALASGKGCATQVIVVDNNSSEEVTDYLRGMTRFGVQALFLDRNYGFSYAVNRGVELADADADILLLNNDAFLTPGALARLQQGVYANPGVAISVPQQVVPAHTESMTHHVPYADSSFACDVTISQHHHNLRSSDIERVNVPIELTFAPFFCAYVSRDAWNSCGGLDHTHGRHYRSDRIMCDFVRSVLKKRILYVPTAVVHHQVQESTRALQSVGQGVQSPFHEMLLANRWPVDLAEEIGVTPSPWML